MWVRGPGNDLNVMSECYQFSGHVAGVDTLAPCIGVTSVGQECDT